LQKKSIKLCGVAIFSNTCQLVGFSVDYQLLASSNGKYGFKGIRNKTEIEEMA